MFPCRNSLMGMIGGRHNSLIRRPLPTSHNSPVRRLLPTSPNNLVRRLLPTSHNSLIRRLLWEVGLQPGLPTDRQHGGRRP
jgi:hypothetical protein